MKYLESALNKTNVPISTAKLPNLTKITLRLIDIKLIELAPSYQDADNKDSSMRYKTMIITEHNKPKRKKT
jgi:hypothetical protein